MTANTKSSSLGEMISPSSHPFIPAHRAVGAALLVSAGILISRLVIISVIYRLANGHEYTFDATIWKRLAEDPLQLFLGWDTFMAAYPPLQPPLEGLFYLPLQHWFGDFIALRATSAIYESIGAGLVTVLLARVRVNPFVGWLVLATLLLNPIGWVTSALWGQDETMFFAAATAVLLLVHANRPVAAILIAAISVVAVKIFFLVVLLPMIVFLPWRSIATRALLAVVPIVGVYVVSFIGNLKYLGHINFSLMSFEPDNDFTISFWSAMTAVFHWPAPSIQRPVAGLLSLFAGLVICAAIRHRRSALMFDQFALLTGVLLIWVLFLFYHINPEYYIFLFPYCFVLIQTSFDFFFFMIFGAVCWGTNYAFAIKHNLHSSNPVHEKIVAFYLAHVPIDINLLHPFVLTLFAVLCATFAAKMTFRLVRSIEPVAYH